MRREKGSDVEIEKRRFRSARMAFVTQLSGGDGGLRLGLAKEG